jgi:hypothetical protein
MYYHEVTYALRKNKTDEEILLFIYVKSENDRPYSSDLLDKIRDATNLPEYEEIVLHGWNVIDKAQYDKKRKGITSKH